jgi:hypothetical protein
MEDQAAQVRAAGIFANLTNDSAGAVAGLSNKLNPQRSTRANFSAPLSY